MANGKLEITMTSLSAVAVGTEVALGPPRRSRRAALPHRAPVSGSDAQTLVRIRMHDFRIWKPFLCDMVHSLPVAAALMAASLQNAMPQPENLIPEGLHSYYVTGHAIVLVMPHEHTSQPCSSFPHRGVHALAEFLLDLLELGTHLLAFGLAKHDELSVPGLAAYVREAKKV